LPAISGRQFTNGDTAVGVGLIVSLIAVFLPWYSASFSCSGSALCGSLNTSVSVGGLNDWPGWLFFLAVIVGIALFVIRTFIPTVNLPDLPQPDAIIFAIIGIFMAVMAVLWLLLHSGGASGPGYSVGPSFGLFVGLIAAIVVAVGGFLKRSDAQPVTRAYTTPGPGPTYGGTPPPPPA
jgi:Flp pilus assembly pilin Flp